MKTRLLRLSVACLTLLTLSIISPCSGTVVTFDDLSETGSGAWFSFQYQGYQGLIWNNIQCFNAILYTNVLAQMHPNFTNGLTGDYYGMVSASNVVRLVGIPSSVPNSEIDSPGTNFNFFSAYLTGEFNSNLNIEVQGFSGTDLLYDQTVVASATNATLFTFNYLGIDRLYFASFGGQPAFGLDAPGGIVMDDFSFEFVPEPSTVLLAALGALTLCAFLKRKPG
jgi:hypothetical protein